MSSEQELEQKIQAKGLNAPRLTPSKIDSLIVSEVYFTAEQGALANKDVNLGQLQHKALSLLTICVLVLENGFVVTGESACASEENFNEEIGREIAFKNAREKIWELEGYLLKEKMYKAKQALENLRMEDGTPALESIRESLEALEAIGVKIV